jgi:hypothetical protein
MNMNMVILSGDRVGGLYREMSRCSAPTMSVKDRTIVGLPMFETLQLATCFSKPKISVILSCERPITHWEWRDGETSVYPHGQGLDWRCTILSGGARPGHILEDLGEG